MSSCLVPLEGSICSLGACFNTQSSVSPSATPILYSDIPLHALLSLRGFAGTTTIYPAALARMGSHAFGWCNCPHCPQSLHDQQRWSPSYSYISLPTYQPSHRHHVCDWCELWGGYTPNFVSRYLPRSRNLLPDDYIEEPSAVYPALRCHGQHTPVLHGLPLRAIQSGRVYQDRREHDSATHLFPVPEHQIEAARV